MHFEINNLEKYRDCLKQAIASNTSKYAEVLIPYLTLDPDPDIDYNCSDDLKVNFIGSNPLKKNDIYDALIKEQINFISSLIQENKTLIHATRAAISQVMARNMSHNHGSHVLAKLTTSAALSDEIILKRTKYSPICRFARKDKGDTKEELLAQFLLYQKQRMDFLADIATNTPTLENTKFLLKDILAGLDRNKILLEHISGTDLEYSFDVLDCRNCKPNGDKCEKSQCTDFIELSSQFYSRDYSVPAVIHENPYIGS